MISVRWRPSSWMQFSRFFFLIVHDTGQQLTIDGTIFLTDGFLQIIQRTGFVSVNTWFQIPPKKKTTHWKIGRARGPRHVSETGNEVPGKHVSNNGHWLVCIVRCGTILLKPCIGTVYYSAFLLSTTHSKDVRFPWVTLYFSYSFISIQPWRPGLAGTRDQSCDRYGSGTRHPWQVLGGSLPLLSPAFRRSHFSRQVSPSATTREILAAKDGTVGEKDVR